MNLPTHRSAGYGRTHSTPYRHYMGIEHARKPLHERLAPVLMALAVFGGFAAVGVILAIRG